MRTPFANFDFNFSPGCKCECSESELHIYSHSLVSISCTAESCPALLVIIIHAIHAPHAHPRVLSAVLHPRGESSIGSNPFGNPVCNNLDSFAYAAMHEQIEVVDACKFTQDIEPCGWARTSEQVGSAPSYVALKLTPGKYVACDIGTSIMKTISMHDLG